MKILVAILTAVLCATNGYSFGPRAHRLVGAIADRRLTESKVVQRRLRQLLDGMSLERASTLPDEIKSWGGSLGTIAGSDSGPGSQHSRIDVELRAFVNANSGAGGQPRHSEFHFAEVPVFSKEKYAEGTVGRSDFDVVQIIRYCVGVLKGQISDKNERAITKTVAVILLVHLLADVHNPLHVGAQYFNEDGVPFNPTPANRGYGDQAGNKLNLFLGGMRLSAGRLHGYWDGTSVENAFGSIPDTKTAVILATDEPADWKLASGPETWGEALANETLPLAAEAYGRLEYRHIKITRGSKTITSGDAVEKGPATDNGRVWYAVWSASVVKHQIHKAGWRLAALLEETLQ